VLDNVRMWLEEFHFDGLRLDAIHAIFDCGARHILRAIQEVAAKSGSLRGWPAIIVAESDLNDPRVLYSSEQGGHGLNAQWSDDFHHAIHASLTGERRGYYLDFGAAHQLATALATPFVYAWEYSPFRGRKHGAAPEGLSAERFVVCIQNHDQVGNRARGDRLGSVLDSPAKARLAACLLLLSPYLPLLFMGEEYGEEAPFPFFCSFGDAKLVQAVREGRKREFDTSDLEAEVPDPQSEATFASAKLSWSWPAGTARARLRRLYRDLIAARRNWLALRSDDRRSCRLGPDVRLGPMLELVRGDEGAGHALRAIFNLGDRPHALPSTSAPGTRMLLSSEHTAYGGSRNPSHAFAELQPFECLVFGPDRWPAFPLETFA
jgi:maltooligosyltrehalose trehalohydrolase